MLKGLESAVLHLGHKLLTDICEEIMQTAAQIYIDSMTLREGGLSDVLCDYEMLNDFRPFETHVCHV